MNRNIEIQTFVIPIFFDYDRPHYSPEVLLKEDNAILGYLELSSSDGTIFRKVSEQPLQRHEKRLFVSSQDAENAALQIAQHFDYNSIK